MVRRQVSNRGITGPDFSRCGEFVQWSYSEALADEFVDRDVIGRAKANIGQEIELCRWPNDPNDVIVRQIQGPWWSGQKKAFRAVLGPLSGLKAVVTRKRDGDEMVAYIRMNRKREQLKVVS